MLIAEIFGYAASALVFAAFYMDRMVPLRLVAIASNIAFIAYAWLDGLMPVLLLHGALLPLNALRLYELQRLAEEQGTPTGQSPLGSDFRRMARTAWSLASAGARFARRPALLDVALALTRAATWYASRLCGKIETFSQSVFSALCQRTAGFRSALASAIDPERAVR